MALQEVHPMGADSASGRRTTQGRHRTFDTEGIRRAQVIVDDFQTAVDESGDVMITVREAAIDVGHFRTDRGSALTGAAPGRTTANDITQFHYGGLAIQDLADARMLLNLSSSARHRRRAAVGTNCHSGRGKSQDSSEHAAQ
jgi:ornithine cyclodeaminase/alanine dehydrogenase-like protein (mu-crystallin family)